MSSHTVGAMTFGARELKPSWRASAGKSHDEQSSVREVHPSNMQMALYMVANEKPIGSFISLSSLLPAKHDFIEVTRPIVHVDRSIDGIFV